MKDKERICLFYFSQKKNSKTITAVGLGKDDGRITLTRKQWVSFIITLLDQIWSGK